MSVKDTRKLFYELTRKAEEVDADCTLPIEPVFEEILQFVLTHPDHEKEFIDAFVQIILNPDLGPYALIQYCMHALRWKEMKEYILEWLQKENNNERLRYVLKDILWSFEDDWDGAILYGKFKKQ